MELRKIVPDKINKSGMNRYAIFDHIIMYSTFYFQHIWLINFCQFEHFSLNELCLKLFMFYNKLTMASVYCPLMLLFLLQNYVRMTSQSISTLTAQDWSNAYQPSQPKTDQMHVNPHSPRLIKCISILTAQDWSNAYQLSTQDGSNAYQLSTQDWSNAYQHSTQDWSNAYQPTVIHQW